MNAIEINGLNKAYKKFSLDNVSFSVEEGTICGFIGENGAGKSTTLKILAGINFPKSGSLKIFNKEIKDLTEREREDISFILDELNFPENIKISALNKILSGIYKNWESDTFEDYLKEFSLDESKKCKELSKGMKVKLNLAIALSHKAKVFIFDEPMNGLDPVARDELLEKLAILKSKGCTVLLSSHLIDDLERCSDKIVFIHKGKIILDENKNDILNNYETFRIPSDVFLSLDKSLFIRYKNEIDGTYIALALKGNITNLDEYKEESDLNTIMVNLIRGEKNEGTNL